jgi:acetyltransferase
MTTRNLTPTLRPQSVALIGASDREGSVGSVVLRNVTGAGFEGAIFPVNLKYNEVGGLKCYNRAADLPAPPDLAVIMTPPTTVPSIVAELAELGCKGAVVITAGIDRASGLRQRMLDAARPSLMRIVGPNTIGLLSPHVGLNASFTHLAPQRGGLGLISQSGAIVSSIVDWAAGQKVGFSQLISLGDMADVDVGDCLNWLAADRQTTAILMYLETIPAARKFMSAARATARVKPVICVKAGRHGAAAKAALTHTGSLAGSDAVIDAALRRAAIIRVDDLEDLFYASEVTARFRPIRTGRVAIVTNGGGAGVLAVDKLLDESCTLAELAPETLAALGDGLPATWSKSNPVDIIGDAPPERYRDAVSAVAKDPGVDVILAMNCPTALASPVSAAAAVAEVAREGLVEGKPLLACWLGKEAAEPAREVFRAAGIATVDTPTAAAEAVALLTRWASLRARLDRVPASSGVVSVDRAAAAKVIVAVAAEGRRVLTEPEAKAVLAAYGVAVPATLTAATEGEVEAAARELLRDAPAVVVKMLSRTITHKSDIGGVVLNLASPEHAREAAVGIRARFAASGAPLDQLDGFTVQAMIRRPAAEELLVGLHRDPGFGPVVVFGAGGTAVETIRDTATGLVPLDDLLAGDLIDRTRVAALLAGYRDRKPADRSAIIAVLLGVSQLAIDFPCIAAADINPLLADEGGVIALDARIEIDPERASEVGPPPELAIRPYPAGWDRSLEANGEIYTVRPMRPADAALYPRFLERVTPDDLRLRFLVATRTLSDEMIVRLSQLDYDRDIAFIALERVTGDLAGVVRYSSDPDHITAEFSAHVRSDLQGRGLGTAMMRLLIEYARADGLSELIGHVLRENHEMLEVAEELGFAPAGSTDDDRTTLRVVLPLQAASH